MKRTFYHISSAIALLVSPVTFGQSQTQETIVGIEEVTDSGFNALDYVLQRPAPPRTFQHKKFGDRLFVSLSAGADWTRSSNETIGRSSECGIRGTASIGDWITPVHGWRVSIEAGQHHGLYGNKPYFAGVAADYMMNLTNLLKGDNRFRRFELNYLMGIEAQATHIKDQGIKGAAGVHIGFQPRLYLNKSTFLFVEPRIGVYTDGIDRATCWQRYDWNASLSLGIGYRMYSRPFHKVDNSLFDNECFADNIFYGLGVGADMLGRSTTDFTKRLSPLGTVFIGKWFNATSALRLSATGERIRNPQAQSVWGATVDLDYIFNLNSAFNGYDPDRKIEANAIAGPALTARSGKDGRKIEPGIHLAVQGIWNITRNFGLYLEPHTHIYAHSISGYGKSNRFLSGANIGMVYRTGNGSDNRRRREEFTEEDFLGSHQYFTELTGGIFMRSKKWNPNETVAISWGKWFSPGNAWRLSGEYNFMREHHNRYRSVTGSLDYIGSLSVLSSGFNDERIFDLSAFVGATLGAARYKSSYNSLVWGPRAGIRGAFRVSGALDIIIEPRVQALHIPHYTHSFTPEFHLQAGVAYKFGQNRRAKTYDDSNLITTDGIKSNYVAVSGGPTIFSETILNPALRNCNGMADITVGHWFTQVSALQGGISYDFINRRGKDPHLYIGTLHIDYMLNLTALAAGGRAAKRFNLSAFLGAGMAWSNHNIQTVAPEVEMGLQARYNITKSCSLMFTPTMAFWQPAINGNRKNTHHFIGVGRLPLGLTYNF